MIRKYIFAATVLAALVFVPKAVGQNSSPELGVRLSMDVTFPGSGRSVYNTGAGFSLGGVARWDLPKNFFIEPGIMFTYMAMTAKNPVSFDDYYFYEGAAKLYGIRVPVNIGYSFEVAPRAEMAVSTGPYVHFNFSAKQSLLPNMAAPDHLPDRTVNLMQNGWKKVDAGWGLTLSMTFSGCYYVGLTSGVSFTPLAVYGNKDKKIRIHRNMVAVTLGYNF